MSSLSTVNGVDDRLYFFCSSSFSSETNTPKKKGERTITTQIRILLLRQEKKHVITDLMCRISFITIHENVWLDSSLRYCHLFVVCELCSLLNASKSEHVTIGYMWFSELFLLWHYCDSVICVAMFLWFFWFFFFLLTLWLLCICNDKVEKRKKHTHNH